MIKLRWNSKRPVCLCCAACLSVMLFFGCSAGNAGNSTSPVLPSATPSASLPAASVSPSPPSVSELPEALPAPSATPFAVNPVYAFYAEYHADCAALLDAYAAGLSALQSVDGLSYSLALTEHRALLSEGRITIARLFGSDESGYSGALESAASGSGSMYGSPEKGYTFQFSYTDGNTLSGSLSGTALRFTISSPKGVERFCSMEKAGDTWLSTACTSSYQSELTVYPSPAEGETPIRFGMLTGNYLPVTESTAAPEGE